MKQIARREYPPVVTPCPVTELPFVKDIKTAPRDRTRCFWSVERTSDYGAACDTGREYAAHYLQYLRQNPHCRGMLLTQIVAAMGAAGALHPAAGRLARDGTHGYAVGFLSLLDHVLQSALAGADPYAIAEFERDRYAECLRRAAAEEALEQKDGGGLPRSGQAPPALADQPFAESDA